MATRIQTEHKLTELSGIQGCSATAETKPAKPKAKLPASELFQLGTVRRPLPSFVDQKTIWEKVPADVQNWIRENLAKRPVVFPWYWFGPVGCGKSSAAACVYQAAPDEIEIESGEFVRTTPAAFRLDDLAEMVKRCRRFGSCDMTDDDGRTIQRSERQLFAMLRRASIVLIDEVGLSKPKDGTERAVVDRICHELQFCRTLYTSNIQPKKRNDADQGVALMDIYDARIASRILGNGVAREFVSTRMRNRDLRIQWKD